ncbi:flagellin N-terminal helical domain-containing protein [Paenibacillus sp. Leaf72]|uniref:flagellin N-terminal helical domain-containing protein n=1 Tax=Paenibacillus sp. Leaf72 TaxID=1736234 RepID=UPI00070147B9|nr:flagellin [Paenibacillus sp. Leaf72]KQO04638.1 hypothetical protein ASF12_14010 [Paenibacillus sp. Leaf72]
MYIRSNLMAVNANRSLTINNDKRTKSMEKLSSGLNINRAADDAAGMSISEKMRGQIRGLQQASRNIQDGISLIQTAEGAMQEIHAILQRMNELAVQTANGTYSDTDRKNSQNEFNQLQAEIDNIAEHTNFNGIKLLNGEASGDRTFSANYIAKWNFTGNPNDEDRIGIRDLTLMLAADFEFVSPNNINNTWVDVPIGVNINETLSNLLSKYTNLKARNIGFPSEQESVQNTSLYISGTTVILLTDKEITISSSAGIPADLLTGSPATLTLSGESGISIQTGTAAGENLNIGMPNVNGSAIGVAGLNISSHLGASNAIVPIKNAINTVSSERAKLGAYQNRLEHTGSNILNYGENLSASESRIRDSDMAREIMELAKSRILTDAGQAMLVQAKMIPQNILKLLS